MKGNFSGFRSLFFPIHNFELKRFLPMAMMMFFILFNYTVLRNLKDSLVINAPGSDAEIISFLKLWGTTPAAIGFMLLYSKLANHFSREKLFYLCVIPLISFFSLFTFVLYPFVEVLHPSATTILSLKEQFPRFKWFITMGGNWSYALFYILSELWGSITLGLLFWQFANEISSKDEAKRFYPLFGLIGNLGVILAGSTVEFTANLSQYLPSKDPWYATLMVLTSALVFSGASILVLYYWMNRNCLLKKEKNNEAASKKKKPKLSVSESLKYVAKSPHLICIALIVLSYGITINFVDVLWKGQVKAYFGGDHNSFNAYMGNFSKTTGMIALPLMLLGGNILRRLSWLKAAIFTPLILIITGIGFFGAIFYGIGADPFAPLITLYGTSITAVGLAVQFGFWQNAVVKATKYSLFDPTKEMAYIPLDEELKIKGKAAVDVVGSRAGKSGGACTFFALQTLFPGVALAQLSPYIFIVFLSGLTLWFISLFRLNLSLEKLNQEEEKKNEKVS